MPEIRPQPEDILLEKLSKLRCKNNCNNPANYLILSQGLYCTQCLADLDNVNPDQLRNFEDLSRAFVQLIQNYVKNTKSEISYEKLAKGQMTKELNIIRKLRDVLNFESKTLRHKTIEKLEKNFNQCLKETTVESFEALFEPSLTVSTIMNEQELLLANLQLLNISEVGNSISYEFKDSKKKPEESFKKGSSAFKQIRKQIQSSNVQLQGILENFNKEVSKQ